MDIMRMVGMSGMVSQDWMNNFLNIIYRSAAVTPSKADIVAAKSQKETTDLEKQKLGLDIGIKGAELGEKMKGLEGGEEVKISPYDPSDYTSESWTEFEVGGREDPSVLKRYVPPQYRRGAGEIPYVKFGDNLFTDQEVKWELDRYNDEIDDLKDDIKDAEEAIITGELPKDKRKRAKEEASREEATKKLNFLKLQIKTTKHNRDALKKARSTSRKPEETSPPETELPEQIWYNALPPEEQHSVDEAINSGKGITLEMIYNEFK